ncbi:MAG: hypothetical protein NT051_02995 [Candidatus Micrarchaeota archaeon]|nr:hypothetical protein [Candidatus Micrarchaeota archaeon]
MARSETLNILNRRFKGACKILLREEIGEVWEFDEWLEGMIEKNRIEKSCVSGKDVVLGIKEYAKNAKFVSFDEIDYGKICGKEGLGGIKSMDGLISALSGRFMYAGNLVIGKSSHVEKSANISDSHFVYDSALYGDCKYLHKSTLGRLNEDLFGSHGCGESQFCIRCTQTYRDKRCFEAWMTQNCSDVYYSFNLDFCSECMFCFNLRSKKHCIGNLQLEPAEYFKVKERLLGEMAGMLKKGKKLPSLLDILAKSKWGKPAIPNIPITNQVGGKDEVERAFSKTAKLILGTELRGIDSHKEWLLKYTHTLQRLKSASSGKEVLFLPFVVALPALPDGRLLTMEEALWLGEHSSIGKEEAGGMSMANVHESIGKIGFFPIEFWEGKNIFVTDCYMSLYSAYCYMTSAMVEAKYCACGMWPRTSEHCFGFDSLLDCSFCIKCYSSTKLMRCFEVNDSNNCTDCLFCRHNVENCHDCLFCFNVKNLKYAIGNAVVGKEEYERIKKLLLGEIAQKLEKDKKLDWSVYNIGAKK